MADPLIKDLPPIKIGDPRFVRIAQGYPHDYPWLAILKRGKDRNGKEITAPVCVFDTMLFSKNLPDDVKTAQTQDWVTCFEYH
jgi:hypothetical protein